MDLLATVYHNIHSGTSAAEEDFQQRREIKVLDISESFVV